MSKKKKIEEQVVETDVPGVTDVDELALRIVNLKKRGLVVYIFDGTKGIPTKPVLDDLNIPKPRIQIDKGDSFAKISTLVRQAEGKVEEYEQRRKFHLEPSEKTKLLIKKLRKDNADCITTDEE